MNIKKIVHGHFADPNSTRDITGLSGKHLECLINVLKACHLGGAMLAEMSIEEARQYFQSFNNGKTLSDQEIKDTIENELQAAKHLAEILEAINQPYEGAVYHNKPIAKA